MIMNKPITKKNWSYKYMPYATLPWPSFSSAALVLASCITLSVSSGTLRELFSRKSLGCGRNKSRSGPGKRNVGRARRKQFKLHYIQTCSCICMIADQIYIHMNMQD